MGADSEPLYMFHLPLLQRSLYTFARNQGLLGGGRGHASGPGADEGYVLHAVLAALFGPAAPKPFALSTPPPGSRRRADAADREAPAAGVWGDMEGHSLPLLAYSSQPLEALRAQAQLTAAPEVWAVVDWEQAAEKPMPAHFPPGLTLNFQLRACPVVRLGRGASERDPTSGASRPGQEVDAFIAAQARGEVDAEAETEKEAAAAALASETVLGADGGADGGADPRHAVYCRWLQTQVERSGAAELHQVRVVARRSIRLFRRVQRRPDTAGPRQGGVLTRPDVLFDGRLSVRDPETFSDWLARGVGRHRAFGFGMVLLRPTTG